MTIFPCPVLVRDGSGVRRGSLIEGKGGFDEGAKESGVQLPGDFHQLLLIRLDDEEGIFYALFGGGFAVGGKGDHASALFEDTP